MSKFKCINYCSEIRVANDHDHDQIFKLDCLNVEIIAVKSELLTIMIRFSDWIAGNNLFQSIFGSIDHNSMIMRYKNDDQNFKLDHDF